MILLIRDILIFLFKNVVCDDCAAVCFLISFGDCLDEESKYFTVTCDQSEFHSQFLIFNTSIVSGNGFIVNRFLVCGKLGQARLSSNIGMCTSTVLRLSNARILQVRLEPV
jgi:hypothetical protein